MPKSLPFALLLSALLLHACSSTTPARQDATADLSKHFEGLDGCLVLTELSSQETLRYQPERCAERSSPCSTFKIPHALFALDSGILADADSTIQWDGVARDRTELNRDHTLKSAIKYSVVWYFQEVARRLGLAREQRYVDAINYGNKDLSGGLTQFWLGSSLKISADEQVVFLSRLCRKDLPLSARSMEIVSDCLIQRRQDGIIYRGKTGSHRYQSDSLGWWVGWVQKDNKTYVFAANVRGPDVSGSVARRVVEGVLRDRGILPD